MNDYPHGGPMCWECQQEVRRIQRQLHLLAEHLDVDLDLLEIMASSDISCGTPTTWAQMMALGLDPATGEARYASSC